MHGWQAISGGRGEVYVTWEDTGERELFASIISLNADLKISTADVDCMGDPMKKKKELGYTIEGSLECHANTPMFAKAAMKFKNTGAMPRFTFQVTNDDKGAGIGRQTCILKHCLLENLPLTKIDASEDIIKFSTDFSAESFEYPETYSNMNA